MYTAVLIIAVLTVVILRAELKLLEGIIKSSIKIPL